MRRNCLESTFSILNYNTYKTFDFFYFGFEHSFYSKQNYTNIVKFKTILKEVLLMN